MTEPPQREPSMGVGMGGSCPSCKAPIELGQRFCLECGASITPVRKRGAMQGGRSGGRPGAPGGRPPSFPWIPFLAILAVVALGLALAFVGTGGDGKPSAGSTDDDVAALNSTRETTSSLPTLSTASTAECAPTTADSSTTTPGATIPTTSTPTLSPGAGAGAVGSDGSSTLPATTIGGATAPTTDTSACTTSTATTATTPVPTTPTTTASTQTTATTGSGSSESWPAAKNGYTVVIASLGQATYSEDDAQVRAVEAQQHGLKSGVLDSNDFSSLTRELWVVFSGIYDTEVEANGHLPEVRQAGYQGAYVRQIKP